MNSIHLTIRTKLLGDFAVVLLLTAAVAFTGYFELLSAPQRQNEAYQQNTLGAFGAEETGMHMIATALKKKRAFLTAAGEARNKLIAQSRKDLADAEMPGKDYEATYASDEVSLPRFPGHLDCGEVVAQGGVRDGYEVPSGVSSASSGARAAT